jgi:2-keto-4-pentenoate hydratase/2-oxohepta-3-ene-1,7-dioic acid hydratase in catechol pathway
MKYVRYSYQGNTSYGILDGEIIKEISGGLFGPRMQTGAEVKLESVRLLCPCEPPKILAVGWNYHSHLDSRPMPQNPGIFAVPTSALLEQDGEIKFPPGAQDVHYEGELVMVIGKQARNVTAADAMDCVFGFTCGNDISERIWQKNDLQWWRAKGSDTFAPLGPAIVEGFDWRGGKVETRINGATVQSGKFSEMIFDLPTIVSFISQYVTLFPGDAIYTGTPGSTKALKPGDLVEVEIDGIGILRNKVAGL